MPATRDKLKCGSCVAILQHLAPDRRKWVGALIDGRPYPLDLALVRADRIGLRRH